MTPSDKARLRSALKRLPLDTAQERAACDGVDELSDERAKQLADKLEGALDRAPALLAALEKARAERSRHAVPLTLSDQLRVLVVDDEVANRAKVRRLLERAGYGVEEAASLAEAERALDRATPDVMIVDEDLPDGAGLDLVPLVKELDPTTPIVMLGHAAIDLAAQAVQKGADQYLTKLIEPSSLVLVVNSLIERERERRRRASERGGAAREPVDPLGGSSRAIRALAERARLVSRSPGPILIDGETGSGKGLLARWLHRHGPRAQGPLVELNCAALPAELLETELAGHERGAFTGAVSSKVGLLERAHRGTLVLDEIGDVGLRVQSELLRVLKEKRFRRLGSAQDREIDVQLIATTNQDLPTLVRSGAFRADLLHVLSERQLRVPPLRERPEDIPVLAHHILHMLAAEMGRHVIPELSHDAEARLTLHSWPGNVREFRNVLERALLLSAEQAVITAEYLRPLVVTDAGSARDHDISLEDLERALIQGVLRKMDGNLEKVSRHLGVSKKTLFAKMRKLSIGQAPGG